MHITFLGKCFFFYLNMELFVGLRFNSFQYCGDTSCLFCEAKLKKMEGTEQGNFKITSMQTKTESRIFGYNAG